MTDTNLDRITGTLSITVLPQTSGQYICQISSALSDSLKADILCHGQTREHAIATALEQLAGDYRRVAKEDQNLDWDAVERSDSGVPIDKHYHVILHYERTIEAESKFEAMHNTILGNTVVETGQITVIEIAKDLPVQVS